VKDPLAPATKGLKQMMQKLGAINKKHEALVKRVDELEVKFLIHFSLLFCRIYSGTGPLYLLNNRW